MKQFRVKNGRKTSLPAIADKIISSQIITEKKSCAANGRSHWPRSNEPSPASSPLNPTPFPGVLLSPCDPLHSVPSANSASVPSSISNRLVSSVWLSQLQTACAWVMPRISYHVRLHRPYRTARTRRPNIYHQTGKRLMFYALGVMVANLSELQLLTRHWFQFSERPSRSSVLSLWESNIYQLLSDILPQRRY